MSLPLTQARGSTCGTRTGTCQLRQSVPRPSQHQCAWKTRLLQCTTAMRVWKGAGGRGGGGKGQWGSLPAIPMPGNTRGSPRLQTARVQTCVALHAHGTELHHALAQRNQVEDVPKRLQSGGVGMSLLRHCTATRRVAGKRQRGRCIHKSARQHSPFARRCRPTRTQTRSCPRWPFPRRRTQCPERIGLQTRKVCEG